MAECRGTPSAGECEGEGLSKFGFFCEREVRVLKNSVGKKRRRKFWCEVV